MCEAPRRKVWINANQPNFDNFPKLINLVLNEDESPDYIEGVQKGFEMAYDYIIKDHNLSEFSRPEIRIIANEYYQPKEED